MHALHDAFRQVLSVGADIILIICSNGVDQSPIFAVLLGEIAKAYYNKNMFNHYYMQLWHGG
jgi:hypothetical protein